jgi:hypothetical protein
MIHARADYNRIQDPEGKIGADEPVFLLRAQDQNFVYMLQYYRQIVMADPVVVDWKILTAIDEQIARAEAWQAEHGVKRPDI